MRLSKIFRSILILIIGVFIVVGCVPTTSTSFVPGQTSSTSNSTITSSTLQPTESTTVTKTTSTTKPPVTSSTYPIISDFTIDNFKMTTTATSSNIEPIKVELTFENVVEPNKGKGPYKGEDSQIRVIDNLNNPQPDGLEWVKPEDRNNILAVDYTKYFVLLVFNGYRNSFGSTLKITRINQGPDVVVVLAHFDDASTTGPSQSSAGVSQYQVVKISRDQVRSILVTDFRLLTDNIDQFTRATTKLTNPILTPGNSINFLTGTDLDYEDIVPVGDLGGHYKEEYSRISVVSAIKVPFPEEIDFINYFDQEKVFRIDYSWYITIMLFNGFRTNKYGQFKVRRIWKNNDLIYIMANFNDSIDYMTTIHSDATNSQYQLIKINRDQIDRKGAVTFKLIDEYLRERASLTADLTPAASIELPVGKGLYYSVIGESGPVDGPYRQENAQIRIIDTFNDFPQEEFIRMDYGLQMRIKGVNYSQNYLLIVFNGYRTGFQSKFKVHRMWQADKSVNILARLNDLAPGTAINSPNSQYEILELPRGEIKLSGTVTFRLLDENGIERTALSAPDFIKIK
jgi:hypothetical protein